MNKPIKILILSLCLLIFISLNPLNAATLKANIEAQNKVQNKAIKSQQKINMLSEQSTDMLHEYQQVSEQLNTLTIYNQQLSKLVQSQNDLVITRTQQLNSIEQTEQAIVPLMLQMINTLEQFIQLDMPFLVQERSENVRELKQLMDQSDVSSAEKYRQIMETFLQEMEYGHTIETWQGSHPEKYNAVVNYFRMGRVVLVYQSLDKKNSFYWSKDKAQYVPLSSQYYASLEHGLRMARKQLAPEFITLPVSIPRRVEEEK
ncbi:DUF3450 domain-containing protein [sulfur-oxidizing endosymbiont of Gigantopelta aegis]|uniref:DUF3450 domain-containing protein n=1 Tax=sulfur-oxidizing endosymbiont of Gigantopelta aegis TaxID=2794934 RepID=UPI0018DB4FEC|nr:DUF3450 domain-containing protein [sulfur-oxidizing endosymbiont of Gigantopelta aegis]